jgi:hypothetical protein
MNNTDIVGIKTYNPKYDDNLVLIQRDGVCISLEEYVSQKVAEQIKEHFGVET